MSHFALWLLLPSATIFSCESQICNRLPPEMKPHIGHLCISHPGSNTLEVAAPQTGSVLPGQKLGKHNVKEKQ